MQEGAGGPAAADSRLYARLVSGWLGAPNPVRRDSWRFAGFNSLLIRLTSWLAQLTVGECRERADDGADK